MNKLTKDQEDVLIARVQEYVDIAYNESDKRLTPCTICDVFYGSFLYARNSNCLACPLKECGDSQHGHNRIILGGHIQSAQIRIQAALAQIEWLLGKCTKAGLHLEIVDE